MKNLITFSVFFILGVFIVVFFTVLRSEITLNSVVVSPLPSSQFSLKEAPENSLAGQAAFSGSVSWQSRVATASSRLKKPVLIQQGESLLTGEKSTASINFPNAVKINIYPKTEIDIIQTLPENMVFVQASGSASFNNKGFSPVAIRSLALLTYENTGNVRITVNTNYDTVTVYVESGSAKIAFDDLSYTSHTFSLFKGDTYIFYSDTRQGGTL